jgi:hypothetical protein
VFGSVELGVQWAEHAAAWGQFSAHPPERITVRALTLTRINQLVSPSSHPSRPFVRIQLHQPPSAPLRESR